MIKKNTLFYLARETIDWISEGLNCLRLLFKFATCEIGPVSHLNGFHVFPRDSLRKTSTVMHCTVFEHLDTLSFAFLVCIILYIEGKQFKCSVFNFVQYIFVYNGILVLINYL